MSLTLSSSLGLGSGASTGYYAVWGSGPSGELGSWEWRYDVLDWASFLDFYFDFVKRRSAIDLESFDLLFIATMVIELGCLTTSLRLLIVRIRLVLF